MRESANIGKERASPIAFCYVTSLDCFLRAAKATKKKAFALEKLLANFENLHCAVQTVAKNIF